MAPIRSPLIAVRGVSKRFVLRGRAETLRELIPAALRTMVGSRTAAPVDRWALRDVSFTVRPGERLGVIGRNGAGKSTLLRIVSRILRPTAGHVEVRGRVAALIELSAGFHFDLTARDNVQLQGAIFGMRRHEIARRLDAIADFAGVADFMDVPLKRYSTGMVARLGFAIAAHVDAEILLVDEVLAVGDGEFQRKSIAHLDRMVREGRPVVLVSHQLDRITQLCSHAILLRDGIVAAAGSPADCIAEYTRADAGMAAERRDDRPLHVAALSVCGAARVTCGERLVLRMSGTAVPHGPRATIGLRVHALPTEEVIFGTHADACGTALPLEGRFEVEIGLDMNIGPGLYRIDAVVGEPGSPRSWSRGPSTLVRVERRAATLGRAYLNPTMRLLSGGEAHPSIRAAAADGAHVPSSP